MWCDRWFSFVFIVIGVHSLWRFLICVSVLVTQFALYIFAWYLIHLSVYRYDIYICWYIYDIYKKKNDIYIWYAYKYIGFDWYLLGLDSYLLKDVHRCCIDLDWFLIGMLLIFVDSIDSALELFLPSLASLGWTDFGLPCRCVFT